jgi:alkylation response protein AidB-like acyl-CoA dehydrogenase
VRPLVHMAGEAEFNGVFVTQVRVPDSDRIGEVGEGWRVAMTTLMNERTTIGGGGNGAQERGEGPIAEAVRIWRNGTDRSPASRDRLIRLWCLAEVLRLTNHRAIQARRAGNPGPEGSIAKLLFAEINQQIYEFCVDVLGPAGMVGYHYDKEGVDALGLTGGPGAARKMFLRSRADSIEGGTSEIQRNIIGERVLGLPGDVRPEKALPGSQTAR